MQIFQPTFHKEWESYEASFVVLAAICTGLFKMIVGVLTTCHTQYT